MPVVDGKLVGGNIDDPKAQREKGNKGGQSTAMQRTPNPFNIDEAYTRWRTMMRKLYGR